MKRLRWLLFPFSILYGAIMRFRNHLYAIGQKRIVEFDKAVISVGNLSMGGTGKSPMIEYLIRLLKDKYPLATVSRGYGRRTRGFRLAGQEDSATTLGDEPFQFYRKFGEDCIVSVGEERILAIPSVLMEHPGTEVFLLDDAFQHQKVARDLNIMLTDYRQLFYKDFVVPVGNLREGRNGAQRADLVIVTKCPALADQEKKEITDRVKQYAGDVSVFFSRIAYGRSKSAFSAGAPVSSKAIVMTGIAKPEMFLEKVEKEFEVVGQFKFADHHRFSENDLNGISQFIEKEGLADSSIVTTEKDMVRLLPFETHDLFQRTSLFYIPIQFEIEEAETFETTVLKVIDRKLKTNVNL